MDVLPQFHLPANGLAKILRSPGDRILIEVGSNCLLCRTFDLRWSREVGKSLRQVHRAMQHRLPRHLADHRLGETGDLGTEKTFLLNGRFRHGASLAHSVGSTTL